jgi:hypothetical protein
MELEMLTVGGGRDENEGNGDENSRLGDRVGGF